MEELLLQVLKISYAGVGLVGLIWYWPTVKDLYHHKVASANIASYVIWTLCGGVAFLYSIFVLPDLLFQFVSGTGFLACAIILLLSMRLKKDNK